MKIEGVIFDMDGLLVDSERMLAKAWERISDEYGYAITEDILCRLRGGSRENTRAVMLKNFGPSFPFEEIQEKRMQYYYEDVEKNGMPAKKGALTLLSYLKEHGYQVALATASPFERAEKNLGLIGASSYFDVIVSGDMVSKCKPDPELFLTAAKKLSLAPSACMVLEDSLNGIEAALAGGFVPVMVPDLTQPDEALAARLYAKCESLLDVIGLLEA